MNFADAAKKVTYTENGATAFNTSNDTLVDLFSSIGAMRGTSVDRVIDLFEKAYATDKLITAKILFYARDIRGGLGERQTFRALIKHIAKKHPEALIDNIKYIGEFGRYDDLYELVGTPLEDNMWAFMREQFMSDLDAMQQGKPCSLLAKWIKTADASSANTRRLGALTAKKLGCPLYTFKRDVRALRKYIDVVEIKMSANAWGDIDYSAVPSNCMNKSRNAFIRHDEVRFAEFVQQAVNGEVKVNSATLYPYDIVEKVLRSYKGSTEQDLLEAQWRQLPDYVDKGSHAIVMADTSGSMEMDGGRPMWTALGLALYFAERNIGPYKDLFITFSSRPEYQNIEGNTLYEKLRNMRNADWGASTNVEAAFRMILDTALGNDVKPEDMPKALIIVSDMQFDPHGGKNWGFYDNMHDMFHNAGYEIPNVIFWNVADRSNVFHASATQKGVQLVSGQSTSVFKQLMKCIDMTPYEAMIETIDTERYSVITIKED